MKEKIIEALLLAGYKKKWEEVEGAVCFENDVILVCLFSNEYPNNDRKGRVFAEHKNNFDKWWAVYYKSGTPASQEELAVMLEDLKYIQTDIHIKVGKKFSTLVRNF